MAVSADGSTAVGTLRNDAGSSEAFRWTESGGLDLLGAGTVAYDVSGDGSVVVGEASVEVGGFQTSTAFRWTESAGVVTGFGGWMSYASGISADGATIVGSDYDYEGNYRAWRWTAAAGATFLGGGGETQASGVSADGSVIGGSFYEGFFAEDPPNRWAFRWTSETGIEPIVLPDDSYGVAISGDGSTLLGIDPGDGSYRWTRAEGVVPLGIEVARALSADGSLIVGVHDGEAALWDATHGARALDDVLTLHGVDLSGWSLDSAADVSADGRTIVGWGTSPRGVTEAWLVVIPEPDSSILLGVGMALLVGWRSAPRRRRASPRRSRRRRQRRRGRPPSSARPPPIRSAGPGSGTIGAIRSAPLTMLAELRSADVAPAK